MTDNAEKSKILVCINDSDYSRVALRFASSKAKNTHNALTILHVVNTAEVQSALAVGDVMRQEMIENAEKLLEKYSQEALQWADVTPCVMIREGIMGEEIVKTVKEDSNINMVVLGTSPDTPGRGNLLPWLISRLGSELLIPMTIVPGNLTEQQIRSLA